MTQSERRTILFGPDGVSHKLPRNTRGITVFNYFLLLKNVCLSEITTFYSFYLLMLSVLLLIPEVSTYSALWVLLPLLFIVLLEYLLQAIELKRAQKSIKVDERKLFTVIREGTKMQNVRSKNIKIGDFIEFELGESQEMVVPCDCVIIKADEHNVLVNTSKLDGESDAKIKSPLGLPENFSYDAIKDLKGYALINPVGVSSYEIMGEIHFVRDENIRHILEASNDVFNNTYVFNFDKDNFVERGSVIQTSGKFVLFAAYTGKDCCSDIRITMTDVKKTLVDHYIEKVSILLFCIQFVVACALGFYGWYRHDRFRPMYIPAEALDNSKKFKPLILIARNYCLISGVIPITMKLILPLFRFVYGIFISYDLNFYDSETGNKAVAVSTKATENLGSVDLIVSDKTGTLTKGKLKLITMSVGDKKYGHNENSASIIEDSVLYDDLRTLCDPGFIKLFQALSVCHTLNIDEDQNIHGSSSDEIAIAEALIKLGWNYDFDQQNGEYHINCPMGNYRFKIIKVNKFDRERMRMSIVGKINDELFCFMKGASEKVIEKCLNATGPIADYESFQKEGLRTLSVSYRKLDINDSLDIENVESNHTLVGTIAFEDELQNDVLITLDILMQAGIKIWIATGDAKLNTLITSTRLNLITNDIPIVHLKKENLYQETENSNSDSLFSTQALLNEVEEDSFSVVVDSEDDKLLKAALESQHLLTALYKARSVIFYRTKPSTKADISIAIQNFGKNVLSIGDGYNDSALLNSANVGVGIISPNGSRSFTGCDFAIPKFKNLLRLIIIHGHQSLHRSTLTINASFYKGLLIAGAQAIYQVWGTDGTGQSFFDQFATISFDYFWSSIPILSLIFEKDIDERFLFQIPTLYKKLRNPLSLNLMNISWVFISIYQSVMTIFILFMFSGESFINDEGIEYGKTYMSILAFFVLLMTYIFYLIYQTNTFTYYSIILLSGDVILLVAFIAIVQSRPIRSLSAEQWIGFFGECFCNYKMLLIMITIFLINITPSWLWYAVYPEFKSSETIRIIELETISSKKDEPLFFDPPKKK